MKIMTKYSAAAFGLIALLAMTPGTAMARGSLYLDLPGLSIGVHDGHRVHHRKRYRHRHRHGYYYDEYRPRKYYRERRHYKRHHRRNHRYYDNHYYDNYYYGGRSYRRYDRPRRVEVCPDPGYSRYYQRNRGCRDHGDHYHCGG